MSKFMDTSFTPSWETLPNPFTNFISGHVSGRSSEIREIIMSAQSAIILMGVPRIGKSTFIRYLESPPEAEWSWRNESETLLYDQLKLDEIYFVKVDMSPLKDIDNVNELLQPFITQCIGALQTIYKQSQREFSQDPKGLRELLRSLRNDKSEGRFFLMIDNIDRLGEMGLRSFNLQSSAQTPQDRGLVLLDRCGAIRILVDLIDEFATIGVILAIESLPRPRIGDQLTHVSADLARFTLMALQAFSWEDTIKFLAQEPENFGIEWASTFRSLGGDHIFSQQEQEWLREQAGTHPYLLQQFCSQTFHFKQEYAIQHKSWTELDDDHKKLIIETVNGQLSNFPAHIWQRLQEALQRSKGAIQGDLYEFIKSFEQKRANDTIPLSIWSKLEPEVRYILYSEGIVRYNPFQPIHLPGATLRDYLIQKVKENDEQSVSNTGLPSITTKSIWVTIRHPEHRQEQVSLSALEYRLLKALTQHPEKCSQEELMKVAWGKTIDKSTFTQRMYQLRKKLRDYCDGTEIIVNYYGGFYTLNHAEWFQLGE